jgi:hypothetical protein
MSDKDESPVEEFFVDLVTDIAVTAISILTGIPAPPPYAGKKPKPLW